MATFAELADAILDDRPRLYGAWVTDRSGKAHYRTVRSTMGLAHVRLEVQRRAIRDHGPGFTFAVRSM